MTICGLAPDGSGELTTAESQRVLDELKAFIEAPEPVEVQVDMPVDEFDQRLVFDDDVEMTLGGQTVGLHVCDQGLFPCVP